MSRADEMTRLGESIANSFDARMAYIAKLQNDTSTMLAKFDADHATMSKALKAKLAKDRADRKPAVGAMMHGFANTSAQCRNAWRTLTETMQKKRASYKPSFAKPFAKATAAPAHAAPAHKG